ncbi:hypothetical protein GCM10007862_17210 [Dyella lipolytica]|uniref:Uncharacterized protein n=1 Tax=Dyella lipolytica TaxID=1867835 RepID=A0ABW8IU70_9GAMM|nr:hypothetical protein [Dyella lipolytica]GLQ46670.1 hypothetical protein GCM10007862_17210 [Dyella lipolytica]
MKFETLLLKGLFTACLLICVLTMGAMLTSNTTVTSGHAPIAALASTAG